MKIALLKPTALPEDVNADLKDFDRSNLNLPDA
jgi:hypothetical protein